MITEADTRVKLSALCNNSRISFATLWHACILLAAGQLLSVLLPIFSKLTALEINRRIVPAIGSSQP
ncbi:MAG: hypothetical protein WA766_00830, partial [Candidatus Acidiferrales bacterium]